MRIALVYDCLYPHTVGGAERWYRNLGERLAAAGHRVSYLTLRQWPRGETPRIDGVEVVVVGPRMSLYTGDGRRRVLPPLIFGLGVLWHLLLYGRRYDVVHAASFPYFSVLAAAAARIAHRFVVVVDWHEVWSREYWREYLGRLGGSVGWTIQRLCARVPQRAFCFSRLHAERLRSAQINGDVTVLEGEYAGSVEPQRRERPGPLVVFAGRHIPEKRVPLLVEALARTRNRIPELRAELFGDGPERETVLRLIRAHGLEEIVDAPGFVAGSRVEAALARAMCMVLPSQREGYGLIVVEAASFGTPSIVVPALDNAAAELISDGENGFISRSDEPDDLAEAILKVHLAGGELRDSTASWFERNAKRLALRTSCATVLAAYGQLARSDAR